MNYPQGILDLEALVNSQRPSVSLPNFSSAMRPLQYSSNLSKEAQNFQTSMGYFQNQAYRTHARDEQDFGMYESPHMNRIEENLRYQYPNNNALLDYMQQRAIPNNVQIMSANPQIPPLRGERALLEEAHKKRNVRPQSLNAASKSLPPNMDIINLESDETLAQMLHSARGNKDLMMVNNRALQYGLSSEEALSQALLLNSLNYGKTNTDYLMSQLPIDNLCNGMSEYDMISLNPLLMNAISANNSIDNLYKQMQRELLPSGLGQEQQLLLQLGQAGHNIMPEALSVKPKKPLLNQEPILIDDSPEQDTYIPMVNMNPEKERRVVKEEFLTKPSKPYPGFEEIDDRRIMEMYPQYFQDHLKMRPTQTLNNKRFLNDRDPEMQLMGSPEKKFETNNGMGVRTNPNPITNHTMTSNPNIVTKTAKKESKLPMKKEKPPVVMPKERPEVVKQDPVKQAPASLGMNVQVSLPPQMAKKPEPQVQVQDFKRESKQADIMINNNNNKQKEIIQAKKVPKITIDKISLPESAVVQQAEPVESVMKAKQSPTTLHLHKKHGQIQLNAQQGPVEQVNRQPFQLKLVSGPVVKVESSTEPSVLSNEHTQVQPLMMMMMNPLNVNQSPEKLIEFKESPYQSLAVEPLEEEKLSANGDTPVPNKEKTGGRRKKTEPTEVNTEPVKKERKMNKLQMIRFAYQAYLEEIKKPYKISIHIDPTNPDEKIVYAKIGEGYQVDVDSVLYNRQFTKKHNQIAPVWNPDSIHPRKLEEYYQRFGQIIGQKITNEESALKNLQKFDMDVEKALDNASRNKLYYQNSFRLDQRVLRNRAPYVS